MLDALSPGFVFAGDFVIERAYRQSALGAMYVVTQQSTGREGALIVTRHVLRGPAATSFLEEARLATTLPSAHVVEALALGIDEESGRPWLVIEVVKGEELGAWLAARGPLSHADLDRFMAQLCDPLAAAHDVGLVHRDVRPLNVFVGASSDSEPFVLKVRGFGMFRLIAGAPNRPKRTPWSAPELLRGGTPTPSSDVWSLGLLAFHLLTGKMYFDVDPAEADVDDATARAILERPLPSASARAAELSVEGLLPKGFDDWFATCVAREPLARYSHANEARTALHHVLAPNPSLRPPSLAPLGTPTTAERGPMPERRSRARGVLLVGLVAAAAAFGAFVARSGRAVHAPAPNVPSASPIASTSKPVVAAPTIEELPAEPIPSAPAPSASSSAPFDIVRAKQTLNLVNYRSCALPQPGKIVITFDPKGNVASAKVTEGGYDAETSACVERLFRWISIPPFRGQRQTMFVALSPN